MAWPQSLNCTIRQGAPSKDNTWVFVDVPGMTCASRCTLIVPAVEAGTSFPPWAVQVAKQHSVTPTPDKNNLAVMVSPPRGLHARASNVQTAAESRPAPRL